MNNTNPTEDQKGFKELLRDIIIPKMETISAVILLAGLILKYFNFGAPGSLIGIGLTTLAVTSYLLAFLIKGEGLPYVISVKLGLISCSVALVGVMFTIMKLPGNVSMLYIGAGGVGIALLLTAIQLTKSSTLTLKKLGVRYLIILGLTLSSFL